MVQSVFKTLLVTIVSKMGVGILSNLEKIDLC